MDELLYGMELLHSVNVNEKGENENADDYENDSNSTSTKDNKAGMVGFFQREFGTDTVFKVKQLIEVYRNSVVVDFPVPIKLTEKSDLELRGKNLNSGNVSLGGTFDLILVDN